MSRTRAMIASVVCSLLIPLIPQTGHAGWTRQQSGTTRHLYGITANHGDNAKAWACGQAGTILFTSNGGATWTQQSSGTEENLRAISFIEDVGGPVIAVGDNGTIVVTHDGGTHWQVVDSGTDRDLNDISDFGYIAVGDNGVVLRGSSLGLLWTQVPSGTDLRLNGATGTFVPTITADHGFILRTSNGGASWYPVYTGRRENLYGIPMFSSLRLITGAEGLVLRSTDFGETWSADDVPTAYSLRAGEYSLNNDERAYCVGERGTIVKTIDRGAHWFSQYSGTQSDLHAVFFYLDDRIGYVAGEHGTILKTEDGGGSIPATSVQDARTLTGGPRIEVAGANPFLDRVPVRILLDRDGPARVCAYDATGRRIETLAEGFTVRGERRIDWDASRLAAGAYYLRVEASGGRATRRVILLR